ncbi:hypothetical protein [Lactobacillus delbrueckii]|uniref:hypothetical protein n=1 Tax=Lactobacillus delbrueckii TaxID=1584 RepID=UPI003A888654
MGWRNVIITQHSKLSYSSNMMVVHTKDGVSQIPVSDINMLVANFPGFYNSMSKKPTITAFFEV